MTRTKIIHHVLEVNQSEWLKQYIEFNTQKIAKAEQNWGKDGKALDKLLNNATYDKTI